MKPLFHQVEGPVGAPVVVLLHPIATHGAIWAAQGPVWAAAFRVVTIDLPGHGGSAPLEQAAPTLHDYAEAVRAVLDALEIELAAIVGLSLGGMVAQAFALAWPQCTRALVLAHTSAQTAPAVRDVWSGRLASFQEQGLEAQVAPTLERWFTRSFRAEAPSTVAWVAAQIRSTSDAGYAAAIRAIQQLDHLGRLGEISAPTLVVAGADDTAVPPAAARAMADAIPGARLFVLPQAAHLGNVEQPVAFTEAVGRFFHQALIPQETP
ncbi:MAG TPA: alpha/beta fold hydrolase [Ramlibacter sp.]|nr:alpha/beta fold hydrolase [Ramlibacter sp.]